MGEIPDRSVFLYEGMRENLAPYLRIDQVVWRGYIMAFCDAVTNNAIRIRANGTHTLIIRPTYRVVKSGLHLINPSYLRIS